MSLGIRYWQMHSGHLLLTLQASVECVLCEFVIKEVDSLIGNNNTEVYM